MWVARRRVTPVAALYASAGGGAYQGPGDVVSGATAWWGLRAYSAASIGNNVVTIKRSSDNTSQTFVSIAGGGINYAAVASFIGGGTGSITVLYDQTGHGFNIDTSIIAFGLYNSTIISGKGVIDATAGAAASSTNTLAANIAQPFTMSCIAERISGGQSTIMAYMDAPTETLFGSATSKMGFYNGGSVVTQTAADGALHDMQAVINGASSAICVDGTDFTGLAAGNSSPMTLGFSFQFPSAASGALNGYVVEGGFWPIGFTGTQRTNMATNQKTFWGYR